jgi:hypothetical protein
MRGGESCSRASRGPCASRGGCCGVCFWQNVFFIGRVSRVAECLSKSRCFFGLRVASHPPRRHFSTRSGTPRQVNEGKNTRASQSISDNVTTTMDSIILDLRDALARRAAAAGGGSTNASSPSSSSAASSADEASEDWATSRVVALPEFWTLVAEHSGLAGAWRLTGVCVAAREGAKAWLRTLPRLVVCGGYTAGGEISSGVWKLDLGELRWERTSDLALARMSLACCAVRGGVVVLGGEHDLFESGEHEMEDICVTASVEILEYDSEAELGQIFVLPPLSCGPCVGAAAVPIDESESEQGQVLPIGGIDGHGNDSPWVHTLDLATGACTPLPSLLSPRGLCTAARLPDGRIVCVGLDDSKGITVQLLEELPDQGSLTSAASWRWRELPVMGIARSGCGGCFLSDGRFAVFGGMTTAFDSSTSTTSCEVLTLNGDDARWEQVSPMHEARVGVTCVAVGGCVIVAGANISGTVEVYEEALGRWRRLPCSLPDYAGGIWMGRAMMR